MCPCVVFAVLTNRRGLRRAATTDGPIHSRVSDSGASLMTGGSGALGFEGIKEEAHEGADSPDGMTHRQSLLFYPSGGLRTQPSNASSSAAPVLPTAATLATGALLKALGVAQGMSPSEVASPLEGPEGGNVYFSPVRSQLPPGVVLQVRLGLTSPTCIRILALIAKGIVFKGWVKPAYKMQIMCLRRQECDAVAQPSRSPT
jgi:hypothetical protein